jgi:Asp-tRNA(Asn)/Glu-tRNA(Gln) amidotransferase A subunit family amidase
MDRIDLSRRAFLRGAGAAAAAASGLAGLGSESSQAAGEIALSDYERYDGVGLAQLVKAREVKPEELLEAAVERVEQRNPAVNAVINPLYDHAKAAIAAGLPSGPFTGVPYLLKDLGVLCSGTVTSAGSVLFRGFVADHDSEIVARMKRAGLVIFGKTNTPELGLSTSTEPRLFGPTRNPWNLEYSAGGSSGGAAVAVATRMVPMAHATDGGGSIRIPASACGLFGLKPTRARNPAGPDVGEGVERSRRRARHHTLGARQRRVARRHLRSGYR